MVADSLTQFLIWVPSCPQTASLATGMHLYQTHLGSRPMGLMLLDDGDRPVGIVLTAALLEQALAVIGQPAPAYLPPRLGAGFAAQPSPSLPAPAWSHGFSNQYRQLMTPVMVLSAELSLHQAAQRVVGDPEQWWVVVDRVGQYLGLLNQPGLMRWLVLQQAAEAESGKAGFGSGGGQGMRSPITMTLGAAVRPTSPHLPDAGLNAGFEGALDGASDGANNDANGVDDFDAERLLAPLGHDLKVPLTALMGLSSLLQEPSLGPLTPRQQHYTQLIHQNVRRLMATVNDLLDVARLQSAQMELHSMPVAPSSWPELVLSAAQQAHQINQYRGVAVDRPLSPVPCRMAAALPTVQGDVGRLRQMLVALLSNALKASPTGTAGLETVGVEIVPWENWLSLTVWDTGEGISLDHQARLLQPPLGAETGGETPGAGLGLLLVRRLVELHGGALSFVSRLGWGSRFTLLLPTAALPLGSSPLDRATLSDRTSVHRSNPAVTATTLTLDPTQLVIVVVRANTLAWAEPLVEGVAAAGYPSLVVRSDAELHRQVERLRPWAVMVAIGPDAVEWALVEQLKAAEVRVVAATTAAIAHRPVPVPTVELPLQGHAVRATLAALASPTPQLSLAGLTLLHLRPTLSAVADDLHHVLQSYQCRVLEVDDLDQADLLARVWRPHVVLLDSAIPEPAAYLAQFSQQQGLAALPLVTLTSEATQAANSCTNLRVFPCLEPLTQTQPPMALLQVIQVAAGG
jgi:hypothetical protein